MKPQPPHTPQDNGRLMSALLMSLVIFLVYHFFFEKPRLEKLAQQQQQTQAQAKPAPFAAEKPQTPRARADVIASGRRVSIRSDKLSGSISLTGARIDDLSLNDQYATVEKKEHIALLSPSGTQDAYYVEGGWTSTDAGLALPTDKTQWSLAPGSASTLEAGGAVTLRWDNGQGLLFTRTIALDDNYLFTVTQKITNKTGSAKNFNAWHLISRHSLPNDFKGFFVLHEGPLAFLGGKLKEISYKDLNKGENLELDHTQGWVGIADKYWFVGIFPGRPDEALDARIVGTPAGAAHAYQADVVTSTMTVEPGQTIEDQKFIFAGVKNLPLFNSYEKKYNLQRPDLAFDFGMFYLITKPFFLLLHFLMHTLGNVGVAILAITIIIRSAMFPLASKSFRSMAGMKRLMPRLKELQEKYKDNREKLNMEIMELYKSEDANPFSGCWPVLIQMPIFFSLYKCILLSVELRHAPFWGWIRDLSAPDPTNIFNLFGLLPFTPPAMLHIGAWPALFCLTMILQMRLSPQATDKMQDQIQKWMPYMITIILGNFAVGLVIYWTSSNLFGVLQQYYILRKLGGQEVSLLRGHAERRKKKKSNA